MKIVRKGVHSVIKKIYVFFLITMLFGAILDISGMTKQVSIATSNPLLNYDFTEVTEDVIGYGLKWESANKTLIIDGLDNENAEIKLPDGSTIDIQGEESNNVKGILCEGGLTIKGNNKASLNTKGRVLAYHASHPGYFIENYYYGIYAENNIIIKNGNIKVTMNSNGIYYKDSTYHDSIIGISKLRMEGGNVDIELSRDDEKKPYSEYGIAKESVINGGNINIISKGMAMGVAEINGGKIVAQSDDYVFDVWGSNYTTINGGSIVAKSLKRVFAKVPVIDGTKEWIILYNKDMASEEGAIVGNYNDIPRIYDSKFFKISSKDEEVVKGELDGDGRITTDDVSFILQYCTGKIEFTESQMKAADVNGDGRITTDDASLILQYITGKITEL